MSVQEAEHQTLASLHLNDNGFSAKVKATILKSLKIEYVDPQVDHEYLEQGDQKADIIRACQYQHQEAARL